MLSYGVDWDGPAWRVRREPVKAKPVVPEVPVDAASEWQRIRDEEGPPLPPVYTLDGFVYDGPVLL